MATPAFGTAMASMLQTRSQTLTFRATVMDASTDDGTCIVRLAQGGVRRVVVPAGVKVEYGSIVNVSRVIGRNQLVLVGAGSTTVTTTVNNITQTSSGGGGGSSGAISGEFLMLDASNDPLTGGLDILGSITSNTPESLLKLRRRIASDEWFGPMADFSLRSYGPSGPPDWGPTSELIISLKSTSDESEVADVEVLRLRSDSQIETGAQIVSTVATGQPPFVVSSTTEVDNLNAGLLEGYHAADFMLASSLGGASEDLTSQVDGIRTEFALSQPFVALSTRVYVNGMRQMRGSNYTENAAAGLITFTDPLSIAGFTDTLQVDYLA